MFHWKWRKKLIPGVKSRKHLMIYLLDAATRTPSALGLSCQRHQPSNLCSHGGTIWAGHCQVARLVKYGILIVWLFEFFSCREVFGLWGLAGGATDDWYITQVIQNSKWLLSNRIKPINTQGKVFVNSIVNFSQGLPYSYTFELPEFDAAGKPHGFLLPASNIIRVFGVFGLFGIFLFPQVGRQLMTGFSTLASKLPKAWALKLGWPICPNLSCYQAILCVIQDPRNRKIDIWPLRVLKYQNTVWLSRCL